jgi:undecaprenyl-diphosphatase
VKVSLTILAVLLLLFVGFCRIYLGVHNFTDVLGGYLLGIFAACAATCVIIITLNATL